MRKRTRKKLRMILIFSGIILVSPLIASVVINSMGRISAAANRLSEITVGEDIPSETNEAAETADCFNYNFFSEGFGWDYENDEESDSQDIQADERQPYPETWNTGSGEVIQMNYGKYSGNQFFNLEKGGQVRNLTSIDNKTLMSESKMRPQIKIEKTSEPQVLIMHTHTTESYEPYEREYFDSSFGYRTTDSSKNMVMVGDAIAEQVENAGIAVIHDTTIHDYPSYNGSYERSAATVKGILEEYPSIQVVLDIHRDAISSENSLIQPVAEIDGKKAAQVMIISGCDDGTMDMPDYMYNFRFASMLQQNMESNYAGLTRPILFDYRKYNQDLTKGSLLIEVGSHGNTLEQARYAGELIGKSLADVLGSLK
ncbi:MAG: stage II sporulation protein P [Oscillospiraceae bacterium]